METAGVARMTVECGLPTNTMTAPRVGEAVPLRIGPPGANVRRVIEPPESRLMSLDQSTVKTIAHLARIEVRDDELDHLAGELSNIIKFIEQLAEVNTDGVQPMTSVAHLDLPHRQGDFFLVPKVVE
jgi:hypothetical protein